MSKKILFVATINRHFVCFHLPFFRELKKEGYEIHIAAKDDGYEVPFVDRCYSLPIERSPIAPGNFRACTQLENIIAAENYSLISCHTPVGGVIARIAARKSRIRNKTRLVYIAHGFHFFRNAPLINWLLYFPIEYFLARYADAVVTINSEDFNFAGKLSCFRNKLHFINGIGLNSERFDPDMGLEKSLLRRKFEFSTEDFVLICIGDFTRDKNQEFIVDNMPELVQIIPELRIVFLGEGHTLEYIRQKAERTNIADKIWFAGQRHDVPEMIAMADVGVSASLREGLPVSALEIMQMEKPLVAPDIRGYRDIIKSGKNGILFPPGDRKTFISNISALYRDEKLRREIGAAAKESLDKFKLNNILPNLMNIYQKYL
ncbi:MAG: glycosyltransferase family 4 protein [Candidatus Rifleibacteriota bacterium]